MKPLITFHANFNKVSGPMVSGETKVNLDVPEAFEDEIEGIVRLLKKRNLVVAIYDLDEYVEKSNQPTQSKDE